MTAQQIADFANEIEPRLIAQMTDEEYAVYQLLTREQRAEIFVASMLQVARTIN